MIYALCASNVWTEVWEALLCACSASIHGEPSERTKQMWQIGCSKQKTSYLPKLPKDFQSLRASEWMNEWLHVCVSFAFNELQIVSFGVNHLPYTVIIFYTPHLCYSLLAQHPFSTHTNPFNGPLFRVCIWWFRYSFACLFKQHNPHITFVLMRALEYEWWWYFWIARTKHAHIQKSAVPSSSRISSIRKISFIWFSTKHPCSLLLMICIKARSVFNVFQEYFHNGKL